MSTVNESRVSIYNRFNTLWTNGIEFTLDNEKFTPPIDASWVRLSVRNTDAGQETLGNIGSRKFERKGSIIVQVFTSTNSGVVTSDSLCLQAQNIFEATSFEGVICNNSVIREVGVSDGYYQQIVEINFSYNEIK